MVKPRNTLHLLQHARLLCSQKLKHSFKPKSHFVNNKFLSPWECESRGNSWVEMFKESSTTEHCDPDKVSDPHKTDSFIKQCVLKSVEYNKQKVNATERDHCTWIGHSTCLIQTNGVYILTDPVFSDIVSPIPYIGPRRSQSPAVKVDDLPIDMVLLSHNHYDHLDMVTARRIGDRALWVVPLGLKQVLQTSAGISNCIEMDWWEERTFHINNNNSSNSNNANNSCNMFNSKKITSNQSTSSSSSSSTSSNNHNSNTNEKDITVTCLPARHWSARTLWDKNNTLWASFAFNSTRGKYYFGGDTGYCDKLFRTIGDQFNGFDLSLIPIGAYKPRKRHEHVHCDPAQALQMHRDLQSSRSLGIHWGTFNLASDSGCEAGFELHRARLSMGMNDKHFFTMAAGECLWVDEEGEEAVNDIRHMYPKHTQRYLDLNAAVVYGARGVVITTISSAVTTAAAITHIAAETISHNTPVGNINIGHSVVTTTATTTTA